MPFLLAALIGIEARLNHLSFNRLMVLTALVLTFPVITSGISTSKLIWLSFISLSWLLFRSSRSRAAAAFFWLVCVVTLIASALITNSVISANFHFDRERTYPVDNHFSNQIDRFSATSVYLPFRLRPLVFSAWVIPISLLGRGVSLLWFDQLIPALGFLGLPALIFALVQRRLPVSWIIPVLFAALAAGISRNPDTSGLYFLCLPVLISLLAAVIKPSSQK